MSAGLTGLPEWQALLHHYGAMKSRTLSDIVASDPARLKTCDLRLDGLRLNYALDFVTHETMALLVKLAEARDVAGWRARMWDGDKINATEGRAALHVALRQQSADPVITDGRDVLPDIRSTQKRIEAFVESVRDGTYRGATGKRIKHIVNIGIGGSDLGPRLAVEALTPFVGALMPHFVANADAFELVQLTRQLDPAETLFVVVSKTFTTQETLLNAHAARGWIADTLGEAAVGKHFVAVSTNLDAVKNFGIMPEQTFPIWDWVGGRFSLWSAVGMTVSLAIGWNSYAKLLQGAAAMDAHFKDAPLMDNMPVVLAMLGIWSRNFMGLAAHAVLPYSQRLRELPRYLQQLEMESNGKSVDRDGKPVAVATAPIIFGEAGTVGQHGFHQWLHQGANKVSADFIGVAQDDFARAEQHQALLSNMAAQASALAFGEPQAAKPQDIYEGNRPSTLMLLNQLDPYHLGMLLALYEHKVFVQSVVWGINAFDQPGVELGKRMARELSQGKQTADGAGSFTAQFYASILL